MANNLGKLFNPCVAVPDLDTVAHQAVRSALAAAENDQGLILVDATAGRGYDTLFLAQCAAENFQKRQAVAHGTKHVVAFDVQQSSLDQVRQRLAEADISSCMNDFTLCNSPSYKETYTSRKAKSNLPLIQSRHEEQVHLLHIGHEHLELSLRHLIEEQNLPDRIIAIMFNLGFLPRSDKSIVTRSETTLAALQGVSHVLCPHGIATIHCYSGHLGGQEECAAVLDFAKKLPWKEWRVLSLCQLNKDRNKEYLVLMERLESSKKCRFSGKGGS